MENHRGEKGEERRRNRRTINKMIWVSDCKILNWEEQKSQKLKQEVGEKGKKREREKRRRIRKDGEDGSGLRNVEPLG